MRLSRYFEESARQRAEPRELQDLPLRDPSSPTYVADTIKDAKEQVRRPQEPWIDAITRVWLIVSIILLALIILRNVFPNWGFWR